MKLVGLKFKIVVHVITLTFIKKVLVQESYCDSEECVLFTVDLDNSINKSAEDLACNNFKEFSCGKFQQKLIHERYGDETKEGNLINLMFHKLKEYFLSNENDTIQMNENNKNYDAYKQAKKFFNLCMDEKKLNILGYDPIKIVINDDLGGWINRNGKSWEDWKVLSDRFSNFGMTENIFVKLWLDPISDEPSEYRIFIGTPSKSHVLDPKLNDIFDETSSARQNYKEYMFDSYEMLFGINTTINHRIRTALEDTLHFETFFTRALMLNDDKKVTYTIEQLQHHYSSINWIQFFKIQLGMFESEALDKKIKIVVQNPTYIANLNYFLKHQNDASIQNFLIWKYVDIITNLLPRKLKIARDKFFKTVHKIDRFPEQWNTCMKQTLEIFPLVIAKLNVQHYRHNYPSYNEISSKLENLIEHIKAGTKLILKENLLKIPSMAIQNISSYVDNITIINPTKRGFLDKIKLDDYYKDTGIENKDNYYQIIFKMERFKLRKQGILRLNMTVENSLEEAHLDSVITGGPIFQTIFDPDKRYVCINQHELINPNFGLSYPDYLNYVGAGYEISYGIFQNLFYYFDQRNISFAVQLQKYFQESYSNYTMKNFNVTTSLKGAATRIILSDYLVGKTLFKIYPWSKNLKTSNTVLPGLKFGDEKLFWLAFSHRYCAFEKNLEKTKSKISEYNVLSQFRNEIPMNFIEEFSESFECQKSENKDTVKFN